MAPYRGVLVDIGRGWSRDDIRVCIIMHSRRISSRIRRKFYRARDGLSGSGSGGESQIPGD